MLHHSLSTLHLRLFAANRFTIRLPVFPFALLVLLFLLSACGREEATRKITLDLPIESEHIRFVSQRGSVEVKVGQVERISGEVVVRANALFNLDGVQGLADEADVVSEASAEGVQIVRVRLPTPGGTASVEADLTAIVPNNVFISAATSGEPLVLRGVQVKEAKNTNGLIRLVDTAGNAVIDNSNHSVRIQNHKGRLDILTSNGGIELVRVQGSIKAQTTHASIRAMALPEAGDTIVLQSSDGDVQLTVPDNVPLTLSVRAPGGRVNIEGLELERTKDTSEEIVAASNELSDLPPVQIKAFANRGNVVIRGVKSD